MTFIKLVSLAIVASSLVLDVVLAGGENFRKDQYLGVWYTIGATLKIIPNGDISCDWTEVTKRTGDDITFDEVSRTVIDGKPMKNVGIVKVQNSEIHSIFPEHNHKENFTVTSYKNGRDLILHDTSNEHYHILISRDTTASTGAKTALEEYASKSNHHAVYVSHNGCSYTRS